MAEKFTHRPVCVKCGFDRAELEYLATTEMSSFGYKEPEWVGIDLIKVTCERCRYPWLMLPKDSEDNDVNRQGL